MRPRTESELISLKKVCEALAASRKERVTSAHLLAAMAGRPGPAADLLGDFGLSEARLLTAARASTDDVEDPLRKSFQRARDVAARTRAPEPAAIHLLVALLNDAGFAARKALEQCGVDVSKLRVRALNLGLGLVGRRRIVTRRDPDPGRQATAATSSASRRATAIPVFPPSPVPPSESRDEPSERPSQVMRALPAVAPSPVEPPAKPSAAQKPPKSSPAAKPLVRAKARGSRFDLDPAKFPTLRELGHNLTLAESLSAPDRVVGRETEIEQTLDVLAKRQGNNPMLVGAPGVGKTSIVRGLAQRIATGDGVASLDDRVIIEIPVTDLIAGTGVRGALAQRMSQIRKETLAAEGRVVVFFDEIHQLFLGDAAEELSGELKVALARGELPCIGATTPEDYKKLIDADGALVRRFSVVEVDELSREDAFLVLEALAPTFQKHHQVEFDMDALALAVGWTVRYLPGRALPDKAVSVIDLAGARVRRRGGSSVAAEHVAEVVSEMADIPIDRLLETDRERMLKLEELLAGRVVGHESQLRRIASILRRNAAGLGSRRPIGTFLLLGPTGVGKTETAKAVAEVLFFCESAMTRIDLSEFGEAHSVARLIGAPPGYVGHEAGGQLTEAVRKRPYQVILLDEVEKAHPEVLETFLGVFDEGRLTDGRGRTVDFTNTVIMITSNIGADESGASTKRRVGFGNESKSNDSIERGVTAAARGSLAPEMYNRIDEVLVFSPLTKDDVREIARRLLSELGVRLRASRRVHVEFDGAAIEALLEAGGYDLSLGARPMKRTIARLIEAPLAERILTGDLAEGDTALLSATGGELDIDVLSSTRAGDAAE